MATVCESIRLVQRCQTYLVRLGECLADAASNTAAGLQEQARKAQQRVALQPDDHDLGGFYNRGDVLALFQAHFADGIGGDDGRNLLATHGNRNLGDQAADPEVSLLAVLSRFRSRDGACLLWQASQRLLHCFVDSIDCLRRSDSSGGHPCGFAQYHSPQPRIVEPLKLSPSADDCSTHGC
jgi:hypothetical protein